MLVGRTLVTPSGVTIRKSPKGHKLLSRLQPRHQRIVEMCLAGHSPSVIAEALNIPIRTINTIIRSPLFQEELSRRRHEERSVDVATLDRNALVGKARSILEEASARAAEKHVELLSAENEATQLRAAEKILDRVFGKGQTESKTVVTVDADQVNLINLALQESNHVQDTEYTTDSEDADATEDEQVSHSEASSTGCTCE